MRLKKNPAIFFFVTLAIMIAGFAYFKTSSALASELLQLQIANTSYLNAEANAGTSWTLADLDDNQGPSNEAYQYFNFNNFLPGDWEQDTVELNATGHDYWACISSNITENDDNTCNEPELKDDPSCNLVANDSFDGELGDSLEMILWNDDGDNVLEDDETVFFENTVETFLQNNTTLADSSSNIFTNLANDPLLQSSSYFVGKGVCYGNLNLDPQTQSNSNDPSLNPGFSCDGNLENNASQTDSLLGNIEILAVQAEENEDYSCGDCSILGDFGAITVEDSQGLRKNGTNVLVDRSDPLSLTGLPENDLSSGSFYSFGFGGEVVLEYNHAIEDLIGAEIFVYEITGGSRAAYPEETANVLVSQDGINYSLIGSISSKNTQPEGLDINGTYDWIKYIKIVDTSNPSLHNSTADGIDIDAVVVSNQNICSE